ncbi:AlpA family phage regulatory protein [Pseudacidovorax sp. RU35E]|jgi:hypothetical protein|uniref:helix-turn-helix transcriptional regulator n=1 Tax=Pseudacidovorax sp. RU35E TaxID=1907403 RepID=UPI00190EE8CF
MPNRQHSISSSPEAEPAFLRLSDVIRITALSRSTIYRRIAAGEFPAQVSLRTCDRLAPRSTPDLAERSNRFLSPRDMRDTARRFRGRRSDTLLRRSERSGPGNRQVRLMHQSLPTVLR